MIDSSQPHQNVEVQQTSLSPKPEPDISQGEEEMDTTESHNIRGVSKSGRRVKQTQFYGFQIGSDLSGIFISEHDTSDLDKNNVVTREEAEMNPDLLFRSRTEEIKGWKENNVFDEISYSDLEPGTKILSVR